MSRTEFRILGPLQVLIRCEERPIAGEKLQVLLATLLLEANRPVSIDRLIDELWGDHPPATARESIHAHVARLRRVLSPDGSADSSLRSEGRGYVLHVEDEQLDAARFRSALDAARGERLAGHLAAAREQYREALALWRGPVLEGVPLERADLERAELEGLREAALEERIDVDLELGHAGELVPELERLVQSAPLRERTWGQLMLALYEGGRQADALATYQKARRTLAEVGLQPGPTLRELEHSILTQDPSLVTRPRARVGVQHRRWSARGAAAALVAVVATVFGATAFVTRDQAPRAAPTPTRVVANSLVEIDPATNRVVSVTPVGRGPDSIAATADAIWVANADDRTVARVALRTKEVRIYGGAPVAHEVVSGLNDDVWLSSFEEPIVTLIAPRGRMERSERATAAGPRRIRLPGSAEGLAVGGGFLWVTSPSDSGGGDSVFRIDLRSRRLVSSLPVGKLPLFVSFGYGSAWVSNYEGGSVSVIRPGTEQAETIAVPGGPLGIAAGAGAVWVVTFWSRELVRIDPETRKVLHRIRVGSGPLGVAVGAGAIWVTNRDDRTLSRVDPETNKLSRIIRLAAAPYGVLFAHGRVWVTTQHCGSPATPCDNRE